MHRGAVWVWATSLLETSLRPRQASAHLFRNPSRTFECLRTETNGGFLKATMSTSSPIKSIPLAGRSDALSVTTTAKETEEKIRKATSNEIGHFNQNDLNNISLEDTSPFPAILETDIVRSQSVEELLQLSLNTTLILKHACLIVSRLGELASHNKEISFQTLLKDDTFRNLCNLIQRGNYAQNPQSLFLAINGFQRLGILPTSDIFITLEGEMKWALRRCPVRYLARAIELFSGMLNAKKAANESTLEESKAILVSAIDSLQRRWVEITVGSDFISVFKIIGFLNDDTRIKIEDRAVEMVQGFSPAEMRKIFVVLGSQKRRPTPLLRSLAFHLSKSEDRACAKELIELIYALNELSFADPLLMEKLCSDLYPEIPVLESPPLVSSLVTSLGQMRYKHKGLVQLIDEWITTHINSLRPFDFAAWILTCAVLNFQSVNKEAFCAKAKSVLGNRSESELINLVHSLVVLGEHNEDLVSAALSPEVSSKIESFGVKGAKLKLKLLNINAIAKLTATRYKGPFLNPKLVFSWTKDHVGPSDAKLSASVIESLGNFLPADKYLKLNVKLDSGVFVDAICYLNQKLEPLPTTSIKPSESNYRAIAIIVEGYPSTCRGMKEPSGSSILNRYLVESSGYEVIPVPYTEFNAGDKLVKKVKYLEQKLKTVEQKDSVKQPSR